MARHLNQREAEGEPTLPASDTASESLDLVRLRADYASGRRTPSTVIAGVLALIIKTFFA